jgi:hypothetical protein
MANHEPLGTLPALLLSLRHGAPKAAITPRFGVLVLLVIAAILAHGVLVRPLVVERERLDERLAASRSALDPVASGHRDGVGLLTHRVGHYGRLLEHRAEPTGEHELTVATDGRRLATLLAELAARTASVRPLELRLTAGTEGDGSLHLALRLDADGAVGRVRREGPTENWRSLAPSLFAPFRDRPTPLSMDAEGLRFVGVLRNANGEPRALIASDDGRLWNRGAGEELGPWSVDRVAADFVVLRRREGLGSAEPVWLRLGLGSAP